ncbi:MAG: CotS family spore coat protein [Lachnospiraceae bacterium]|nr:CotS family spore coat protein [Lachnospiraceae bacterium]
MDERDLQVLEQYPFAVNDLRRVRGAYLLDTDTGLKLLRECPLSVKRLALEQSLLTHLRRQGFSADLLVPDREGNLVSVYRERFPYMVKEQPDGRECDTKNESEILRAVSLLAELHLALRCPEFAGAEGLKFCGRDTRKEMQRHNRELRKIYTFMKKKNRKNEFESACLSCFPEVIAEAERSERQLQTSAYKSLREQALAEGHFCHGEYIHHNILMNGGKMTVVNFEKFSLDVQINDLSLFMIKILEKQDYDSRLGKRMLEAYGRKKPLSAAERAYLSVCLGYPEKFRKLVNYYYNTNKAWIPGKHMEKLEKFLSQREKRISFSEEIGYTELNI